MKRILSLLAWLFTIVSSYAATAAWKVPLGNFVEDLGTDDRVKKLEKAPAKSVFFQEGDELWDISAALKWERRIEEPGDDPFAEGPHSQTVVGFKWKGDWLVWNARSKLVVASGAWMDLKDAEEALGYGSLPLLLRSRFEIRGGEEGKLQRSLSLVSRSGEKAEASWEGASLSLDAFAGSREWVDLRWHFDWPTGDKGQKWSVLSGKTLKDGKRTLLAGQGQGAEKWQLFATVAVEAIDGTLRSQTRWIEKPEGVLPWQPEGKPYEPFRRTLPSGLQIGIFEMPPAIDLDLNPDSKFKDNVALVEAPPQAIDWVRGHLLDARPLLAGNGIKLEGEGSFAGIGAGCLVVIADPKVLDLVIDSMSPLWDPAPLPVRVETNAEAGGWQLVTRSGEKAEIKRSRGEEEISLFSIEPIVGSDGRVDLRYKIDIISGTKLLGRSDSASTLNIGTPQKVASFSSGAADPVDLILTVRGSHE